NQAIGNYVTLRRRLIPHFRSSICETLQSALGIHGGGTVLLPSISATIIFPSLPFNGARAFGGESLEAASDNSRPSAECKILKSLPLVAPSRMGCRCHVPPTDRKRAGT